MLDQTKHKTKKEKFKAVAAEANRPENAPPGYKVTVILARGGLYSRVEKLKEWAHAYPSLKTGDN